MLLNILWYLAIYLTVVVMIIAIIDLVKLFITFKNEQDRNKFENFKTNLGGILLSPVLSPVIGLVILGNLIYHNRIQITRFKQLISNYLKPILKWIIFSLLVGLIPLLLAGWYNSSDNLITYLFTNRKSDILIISNVVIGETAAEIVSITKKIGETEIYFSLGVLFLLFFFSTSFIVNILSEDSKITLSENSKITVSSVQVLIIFLFSCTISLIYRIKASILN